MIEVVEFLDYEQYIISNRFLQSEATAEPVTSINSFNLTLYCLIRQHLSRSSINDLCAFQLHLLPYKHINELS